MPQDPSPSQDVFDFDLFSPRALEAPDGLKTALRTVEAVCRRGDSEITAMVATLNDHSHILEYVISGMFCWSPVHTSYQHQSPCSLAVEDKAYKRLSKWMATGLPAPTTPNISNTLSMQLLRRFSSSLLSADYPSPTDAPPKLSELWKKVELLLDVLNHLQENTDGALTGVARKKGKATTKKCYIDPLPFGSIGIAVPTTDAEVRGVCVQILSQLQGIFEVCAFIVDTLHIRTNSPSTTFLSSGSQCYPGSSNLHT